MQVKALARGIAGGRVRDAGEVFECPTKDLALIDRHVQTDTYTGWMRPITDAEDDRREALAKYLQARTRLRLTREFLEAKSLSNATSSNATPIGAKTLEQTREDARLQFHQAEAEHRAASAAFESLGGLALT